MESTTDWIWAVDMVGSKILTLGPKSGVAAPAWPASASAAVSTAIAPNVRGMMCGIGGPLLVDGRGGDFTAPPPRWACGISVLRLWHGARQGQHYRRRAAPHQREAGAHRGRGCGPHGRGPRSARGAAPCSRD